MSDDAPTRLCRTIFLSDVHLGTRGCQSHLLLDFLRQHDAETIYLVGDIVDGWRLRRAWYWPQEHNDVVQKLLRKARKGTRVVYVPGNHDEFLRDYLGTHFGGVEVVDSTIHETADGGACSSSTATSSTSSCGTPSGSRSWEIGPTLQPSESIPGSIWAGASSASPTGRCPPGPS
jgi:hypothetical protein